MLRKPGLQLGQQRLGLRHLETALLHVQLLDHAVLDQHRVALRARAHAVLGEIGVQAEGLGEGGVAVGHHAHDAGGLLLAAPGAHDEGVVHRDAPDLVDALGLEGLGIFDEARHVLGRAGRGEGARQAEDGDLLAPDEVRHLEGVRAKGAALGLGLDEFGQGAVRQVLANLDGHAYSSGVILEIPLVCLNEEVFGQNDEGETTHKYKSGLHTLSNKSMGYLNTF